MILFGLKTCDTCRKARESLPDAAFRDLRGGGIPDRVLSAVLTRSGDDPVNRRSATRRELDAAERAGDPHAPVRAPGPVEAAAGRDRMYPGRGQDVQAALLG